MKKRWLHILKLNAVKALALGALVFAVPSVSSAHSFFYPASASNVFFSKEDAEKNITNVKANYNPVAEQISLSFKLAKSSTVSIKLMDALGNEVMNLLNTNLEAGNQNHSFDTNEKVKPGFYFIRVTSDSETVVKRISVK